MSSESPTPLPIWPFLAGDATLLAAAGYLTLNAPHPLSPTFATLVVAATSLAATVGVIPFLIRHFSDARSRETADLLAAVDRLNDVSRVADQIQAATQNWQTAQELSAKTANSSREIADRMTSELQAFSQFLQKSNDSEKGTLRLENEKLRRSEGEWIQISVRLLDHVHALFAAAQRSGQQTVIEQIGSFQAACHDVTRRVGLVPFAAEPGKPFDPRAHQVAEGTPNESPDATIQATVGAGFTYQGQLVRRAIVLLNSPAPDGEPTPATDATDPDPIS